MGGSSSARPRCHLVDEVRGFAVLCMVFYHAFFTAGVFFEWETARGLLHFFMPVEPVFAALFIFVSGFCTRFSRSLLRRGTLLAAIALGITAVTAASALIGLDAAIYFGVIHLIAASMLLWAAVRRMALKLPPAAGLVLSLLLFFITYDLKNGSLGIIGMLSFSLPQGFYVGGVWTVFGFPANGFSSVDYFPLLPWLFMFFAGAFAGRLMKDPLPGFFMKARVPFFALLGRYSLWVYIIHQPVIFLVCWLFYLLA